MEVIMMDQKTGRWKKCKQAVDFVQCGKQWNEYYVCSVCGHVKDNNLNWKYCPYCGSRNRK
jgi:rubrerythrin